MRNLFLPWASVLILVSTAGCGNLNTAYRDFAVDDGSGAIVDIKQRAILASTREHSNDAGQQQRSTVVCAEPSPDALSAYAAELAAEATVPQTVSASLAAAMQESAGFVGLRTQSIQLLRDELYRICEGYMNDAITSAQYDILMRRNQKYMVALLGIEQLTGAMRSPAVVIGMQGSAETAQSISSLREELRSITDKISALEAEKGKEVTSDARKSEIDKELTALNADKQALEQAIKNARGLAASGKAGVIEISYGNAQQGGSGASQSGVASAVKEIVVEILRTDDTGQLCMLQLAKAKDGAADPLTEACHSFIKNAIDGAAIRNEAARQMLEAIKSGSLKADEAVFQRIAANTGTAGDGGFAVFEAPNQ